MNILGFLDLLEDELEKGATVPFSGKALVDRERCLEIIKDIRLNLPEELKRAELIRQERRRILAEAQSEAEAIIKEAEQRINSLVDENEITQKAYEQAKEIIENAKNSAREIRLGAKEYADELLAKVQEYLEQQIDILSKNREELKVHKK